MASDPYQDYYAGLLPPTAPATGNAPPVTPKSALPAPSDAPIAPSTPANPSAADIGTTIKQYLTQKFNPNNGADVLNNPNGLYQQTQMPRLISNLSSAFTGNKIGEFDKFLGDQMALQKQNLDNQQSTMLMPYAPQIKEAELKKLGFEGTKLLTDISKGQAETDRTRAETKKTETDTEASKQNTEKIKADIANTIANTNTTNALRDAAVAKAWQDIVASKAGVDKTVAETDTLNMMRQPQYQQKMAEIDKLKADKVLTDAQATERKLAITYAAQRQDPNSQISRGYQAQARAAGLNVDDMTPAQVIEDMMKARGEALAQGKTQAEANQIAMNTALIQQDNDPTSVRSKAVRDALTAAGLPVDETTTAATGKYALDIYHSALQAGKTKSEAQKAGTEAENLAQASDPNSPRSIAFRSALKAQGFSIPDNLSESQADPIVRAYEANGRLNLDRSRLAIDQQRMQNELYFKTMEPISAEAMQTVAKANNGIQAIQEMKDLISKGQVQTGLLGAPVAGLQGLMGVNPNGTYNAKRLAALEGIASIAKGGGQVTPEDRKAFESMIPSDWSNRENTLQMLDAAQADLRDRLRNYQSVAASQRHGLPIPIMGGQSGGNDESQQALKWAKSNPNDPRSAAILKRLGVQ